MEWNNQWNTEWNKKFALFPRDIEGGKTIWLQHYWQRYVPVENKCGCKGCHIVGLYETGATKPE